MSVQGYYVALSDNLTPEEAAGCYSSCDECGAQVDAGRQFFWGGSWETMCSSICAERHHARLRAETHCDREPMSFERQCMPSDLGDQPIFDLGIEVAS